MGCKKILFWNWWSELLIAVGIRAVADSADEEALEQATPKALAREDFIKRLFAVTLSVGVANQLSHIMSLMIIDNSIDWQPALVRWKDILLIFASIVVVVSSWEGYLAAIRRLPLNDRWRFRIDIALVFSYLFLTLASTAYNLWFSIHAFIFIEYLVWDIFRENLDVYRGWKSSNPQPFHEKSITITVVWLLFFIAIFLLKNFTIIFDAGGGFVLITFAAVIGVIFYRADKRRKWTWSVKSQMALLPIIIMLIYGLCKTI